MAVKCTNQGLKTGFKQFREIINPLIFLLQIIKMLNELEAVNYRLSKQCTVDPAHF